MRTWIPYIAVACLLVGLMSACVSPQAPSPTVTALPTATPTPTPVGGVDPNAAPATDRNTATTPARHLPERFDEGGVERAYFVDQYVIVTGIAVRAVRSDALRDWQVVVLEGTSGTNVLCERPRGHASRAFGTPAFRRPTCACGRSGKRVAIRRGCCDCRLRRAQDRQGGGAPKYC